MTNQAWTPGPWTAEGDDPAELIIWSSPENRVCFLAHSAGLNDDGDFANAHLIAAAPEMFEALQQHQAFLERLQAMVSGGSDITDTDFADLFNGVLALSDMALSKAQGIPESPLWEGE